MQTIDPSMAAALANGQPPLLHLSQKERNGCYVFFLILICENYTSFYYTYTLFEYKMQ